MHTLVPALTKSALHDQETVALAVVIHHPLLLIKPLPILWHSEIKEDLPTTVRANTGHPHSMRLLRMLSFLCREHSYQHVEQSVMRKKKRKVIKLEAVSDSSAKSSMGILQVALKSPTLRAPA
jgi:hypothetical protein